jgi:hypothetical protein
MAATKLDGAGVQKMKTIDEALEALQMIHGMVERMAIEVKKQGTVGPILQQIRRHAATLQGQLEGQFALIAEQFTSMALVGGRGGTDAVRLRSLREHVAQIRNALEIAAAKVRTEHAVEIRTADD